MTTKRWPQVPKNEKDDGNVCTGFRVHDVNEIPMVDRGKTGEPPAYDSPRIDPTVCKHGKGSCEECGTSNRRDTVHTTESGLGAVGKLRTRK